MNLARTALLGACYLGAVLAITLALAVALLALPQADVMAVGSLLARVGGGAALCALLIMQPAVLRRFGVRWQLVGASLLASLLLLGLMLAGAQEMFLSAHDLTILLTMLLFAALLAFGFSLLWAGPMARRIERVRAGTERLASGELETTLPVDGQDEIARLAEDFNRMAVALKQAAANERDLEQARRDLIAAVSHDLRTPLSAVRALIEALSDQLVSDPETELRYLRSAQQQITHLSRLVDDLFEVAQIDAGVLRLSLERASLHDLLSDTLSSFQPQAEQQGVHLIGKVEGDVDPVLINPPKLQRVLHNSLANALRHTPADGTIMVRAAPQGAVVQVEVADTGEGIAPEDLPHIFERTYRGEKSRTRPPHESTSGAGLGLAIARGLIEAHGGSITAESQPGQGARFCFTLQRA